MTPVIRGSENLSLSSPPRLLTAQREAEKFRKAGDRKPKVS